MNILDAIGNTPAVVLPSTQDAATVIVKLESFNAGGSVKARAAREMVLTAWNSGALKRGDTLLEATGGNMGVGLALAAITMGFHFVAVVPDNYSRKRVALLSAYGAKVELSDSARGNDSHVKLAEAIQRANPGFKYLNQLTNRACVEAHYRYTAEEILSVCCPDAFVCSVGSGATFSGVGRRLREVNPQVLLQVVQPAGCNVLEGTAVPHSIQGAAIGRQLPLLARDLVDSTHDVSLHDVQQELRYLLRTAGLHLGLTSGANILAAKTLARRLGPDRIVCTVAPDGGEYYPEVYGLDDVTDSAR